MTLRHDLEDLIDGEVADDESTLTRFSRDASIFYVRPEVVVFPKSREDLKKLVTWTSAHPEHSLTARAGGSDMTGGPINNSIIINFTTYLNQIGEIGQETTVEPGVFYRDLEVKTLEKNLILPCYTASKNLSALGGMISNNCAGERTLRYGKMEDFVASLKVIFADGNEYEVRPLSRDELNNKMSQDSFEGRLYKQIFELIETNKTILESAKPKVSKNSAGYYLWNVWDGEKFDLTRLIVGSQGTLGILTEARIKLVEVKKHHDMIALFFDSWDHFPKVVNALLPYEPESLETFDDATLKLGLRFMPEIARRAGSSLFSFALQFLPEVLMGIKMGGLPKLVILVEIAEKTQEEVEEKAKSIIEAIKPFDIDFRWVKKDTEENKFWVMRRESFNLLREHVGDKKTAPFVEDFCITPARVPEFLPRALKILKESGIEANIAGHAGNGNFHIIPLMDLRQKSERDKIVRVSNKFYDLVKEFGGSITGEHNDGIIRTPFLYKMFTPEVLELFRKTKEIFDPKNIFNPGKKVGGSIEYLESHIARD